MKMSAIEHGVVGLVTVAIIVGACWWVGRDHLRFRRLIAMITVVTFCLIILGAFVRLSDAGLGCPDWPGCYGNLTPHHSIEAILAAEAAQPGGSVSMGKAWKEMLHRYLAMIVGALIAAMMVAAWRNRRLFNQSPTLASIIGAAVIVQAALGAWTVTMLLKPVIVTSHLLGGVILLALLMLLLARQPDGGPWRTRITAQQICACLRWLQRAFCLFKSCWAAGRVPTTPHWRASICRSVMDSGCRRGTSPTPST